MIVRLSDRNAWLSYLAAKGVEVAKAPEFLQIIDKMEREKPEVTSEKLAAFGLTLTEVRAFIAEPTEHVAHYKELAAELDARGLAGYYELDLTIVRGLAYYTGVVFEVFDRSKEERALAGGGRYDNLMASLSDGKVDLPAIGFGMGDVVLGNLIEAKPAALEKMRAWISNQHQADVYVVIANEARRFEAIALVQELRQAGLRVDFPLNAVKVGKQFQMAEQLGASKAVVIGDEWPLVKLKTLATREEQTLPREELLASFASA
jgi:histidyl-tRNA synthetase